jgi:UDP-4-amino-4-deoxy-L-arabinose-oxoglutarate aminotransferase
VRTLRFHGLRADTYQRETQGRAPQAEVVEPGFKYNLPDMNAALGVSQLLRLSEMNAKRRMLAERYLALLADIDGVTPLGLPAHEQTHAWHLFVVRVEPAITGLSRDQFMERLKVRGIGTGLHFRAVHTHAFYRGTPLRHPLHNTEWNTERICSLPLFPDMQLADVERVVSTIRSILRDV